jgi:hypothetical protein
LRDAATPEIQSRPTLTVSWITHDSIAISYLYLADGGVPWVGLSHDVQEMAGPRRSYGRGDRAGLTKIDLAAADMGLGFSKKSHLRSGALFSPHSTNFSGHATAIPPMLLRFAPLEVDDRDAVERQRIVRAFTKPSAGANEVIE